MQSERREKLDTESAICNTDFKTREKERTETKDVQSERREKLDTEMCRATLTFAPAPKC